MKIADAPMIAGWAPAYHDEVVSALRAWGSTGSPVTFRVVTDPEPADIVIHWVDHFDAPYDGWTTVTWEASGRIVTGTVGLAVHSRDGASLSTLERDQVMLHELGHVLGLPHSYSDQSIMRGQVKATEISTDDFQTLRSLYVAPSAMDTTPQDAATDSKTHGCTTVR
ncbi:MAG: matrixin family metalloprotease [Gemmatimonadaceae bacterium]